MATPTGPATGPPRKKTLVFPVAGLTCRIVVPAPAAPCALGRPDRHRSQISRVARCAACLRPEPQPAIAQDHVSGLTIRKPRSWRTRQDIASLTVSGIAVWHRPAAGSRSPLGCDRGRRRIRRRSPGACRTHRCAARSRTYGSASGGRFTLLAWSLASGIIAVVVSGPARRCRARARKARAAGGLVAGCQTSMMRRPSLGRVRLS